MATVAEVEQEERAIQVLIWAGHSADLWGAPIHALDAALGWASTRSRAFVEGLDERKLIRRRTDSINRIEFPDKAHEWWWERGLPRQQALVMLDDGDPFRLWVLLDGDEVLADKGADHMPREVSGQFIATSASEMEQFKMSRLIKILFNDASSPMYTAQITDDGRFTAKK